jgi:hypothetical protein
MATKRSVSDRHDEDMDKDDRESKRSKIPPPRVKFKDVKQQLLNLLIPATSEPLAKFSE